MQIYEDVALLTYCPSMSEGAKENHETPVKTAGSWAGIRNLDHSCSVCNIHFILVLASPDSRNRVERPGLVCQINNGIQ
jgi:hypothetical protein